MKIAKNLKNISKREIETCVFPYASGFINFITKDRLSNI